MTGQAAILGPEHPDTAVGLNNLANLLREQGDLAAAQRLDGHVHEIRENRLDLFRVSQS